MNFTLFYENGEVVVKGQKPEAMSEDFRNYFEDIKSVYQKHMDRLSKRGVPVSSLDGHLTLSKAPKGIEIIDSAELYFPDESDEYRGLRKD